jgi:outer membrane protein OmpA-like peptidoglycan-associated protein
VKIKLICVTATTLLLGACAHQPPPDELIEARSIYARASAGPAAQHAPARLKLARQALEQAEFAYGSAPRAEVQDRAYIAIRRAEAAEAEASAVAAAERRSAALRELATLSGVHADRARAELGQAQQRASEAGQRADLAQARVAVEQSRADGAERNAMAQQQRAQDAEARAQQALEQLSRLAQVKQESRGVVITLSGQVLFVTNQSQLLPAAQASLDNVATALKQVPPGSPRVVIEGHTDSVGPREYNLDLARRRAEAVRDFLVSRGVRSDLFTVQGVGPDRPVASNSNTEGRANNRRVEIVIPSSALALDKLNLPDSTKLEPASATRSPEQLHPAAARLPSSTVPAATSPALPSSTVPAATPPAGAPPAGPTPTATPPTSPTPPSSPAAPSSPSTTAPGPASSSVAPPSPSP